MRVQATRVMAKALSKAIKGNYCIEDVTLVKVPHDIAYITLGGGYRDCDINWGDGNLTVKALQVIYKPECYAMPQYVTTGDLCRLAMGIKTFKELVEEFKNEYEI